MGACAAPRPAFAHGALTLLSTAPSASLCPRASALGPKAARTRGWRRARRLATAFLMVVVVGVVGCSGSGKSTLCSALAEILDGDIVTGDDFFRPDAEMEPLDLSELPWPNGAVPAALSGKTRDNNAPSALNWCALPRISSVCCASNAINAVSVRRDAFAAAVDAAHARAEAAGRAFLFIDSFMLLSPEGRATVAPRVGRLLYLDHSGAPPDALLDRKWARARPNSRSYRERGVSREEYAVYLEGYVLARFAAVTPSAGLPAGALALPCELPTPELVRRARAFLAA